MIRDNSSLAGIILKTQGTKGELLIQFINIDPDGIEPGDNVFIEINGMLIPFFIEEISPGEKSAVLKLEYIDSINEAAKLCGYKVFIHNKLYNKIKGSETFSPSEYINYSFIDLVTGTKGTVKEYLESESNPLLIIESSEKEFLVPLNPEIIVRIDKKGRKLEARLPEGLIDL